MKDIERYISPLIESQFPAFYREEGQKFIAFVKAYYEWLEEEGNPVGEARKLLQNRDIDSTLEEFIVFFKEKYLKNIQFDTSTNKKLLVKNSLELYRSKGTERSIDLFFKLVYGTPAEVRYPSEKIFRLSDGVWEKPVYLEISSSKYNIDYVGKQIIGYLSGATAFVEKFLKRRAGTGYVNILYLSNVSGTFARGETLGIVVNGVGRFDKTKRAKLLGSIDSVIIQDGGSGFSKGDLVKFEDAARGKGGTARVAEVSDATGLVDFIFVDGGWGYTTSADILVSEKVIAVSNVVSNSTSNTMFSIFDSLVEPMANLEFTSAAGNIGNGSIVSRYNSFGQLVAEGKILSINQTSGANVGSLLISVSNGAFTNSDTYYTESNALSFYANTVTDKTITGTIMGFSTNYALSVTNQVSNVTIGDLVTQRDLQNLLGKGTVSSVAVSTNGNTIFLEDARGTFKKSSELSSMTIVPSPGTMTCNTTSNVVTGNSTSWSEELLYGTLKFPGNNATIGVISAVINSTAVQLSSTPTFNATANNYKIVASFPVKSSNNASFYAEVTDVSSSVGVYNINRTICTITYSAANNTTMRNASFVYQYNPSGVITAYGKVITSVGSGTTGNLTIIPLKGNFEETSKIYADANTARAIVDNYAISVEGGDYYSSGNAMLITINSDTIATSASVSSGTGADANVSSIEETQRVIINTDLINSNNYAFINNERKALSVSSSVGFDVGDYVYQETEKVAFNPSTAMNRSTGFFALQATANAHFAVGDYIKYTTSSGNTAINGLSNGAWYYVYAANSTGISLAYPLDKSIVIANGVFTFFGNNAPNESGHFFLKEASGTIFSLTSNEIRIDKPFNTLLITAGTANTTNYANGNLVLATNSNVNVAITNTNAYGIVTTANQLFYTVPLRSAGFGFAKKPTGDIKDTIYSLLSFRDFTIGSIVNLTGIDPGSDYNVDPFVTAYQEYIPTYNKKDFVIEVDSGAFSFVVGEKIIQSLDSLSYYDLQVNSGVYSNSFSQQSVIVNSTGDVNTSSDFVFTPVNTHSFNSNTSVNSSIDFISLSSNPMSSNTLVRYYTSVGNTVVTGLSNNGFYYLVSANTSGFKLAATVGGANIDITSAVTGETGHFLVQYDNEYANDTSLIYRTAPGNTAISGLSNNQLYYVVYANSVGFALALTKNGANVNLT